MTRKNILPIIGLILLHLAGCTPVRESSALANYYIEQNSNRTAAEWEPALGTMVVWPLSVPYKLVIELARDNHLYTLVENDSAKFDAEKYYNQWGINPANNTFIYAEQDIDSWWTRDWGPSAVFTREGKMKLGDGKYIYSTPVTTIGCSDSLRFLYLTDDRKIIKTETEDNATIPLAKGLELDVLDLPFINTGGNVLTDGLGSAFSTCILLNENRFYQVNEDKFFKLNKELLGIQQYHIISNFEKSGIQHIDCFMKLLDAETILVAQPPANHELHAIYENIVEQELKKLRTPFGRPYEIKRIKTNRYTGERLAAYTNSIILNRTVYVPLFQIKEDSMALETWKQVMPGYSIKGFTFALKDEPVLSSEMKAHYKTGYGWNGGDALHCRTRAVWDKDMLFIATRTIDKVVRSNEQKTVYATIIDYSKQGLVQNKSLLFWRVVGDADWHSEPLKQTTKPDQFYFTIPFSTKGKTLEYYVSVESKSGRKETQPRTAPQGTYRFSVQ